MPPIPAEQCAPYGPHYQERPATPPPTLTPAEPGGLPVYVRYKNLVAANIVQNWPALIRLIEQEQFPEGVWLGRNTRAWRLGDIEAWLASRPTARKILPVGARGRGRPRKAATAEAAIAETI
jgi:Prophage CP4-57 regulatory protein (AlpA)/AT hook motif